MIIISNTIKLQNISIEDQPKLIKLIEVVYPPTYKHIWKNEDCNWYVNKFFNLTNLRDELLEKDAEYYFVIYNSINVGIIRIHYNKPYHVLPEKKATYLHRIYLGEEAQGKGVAKQLFNWVETLAKQKGSELVWLKAMDTQQQALRFYEKQGFTISGTTCLNFELLHKPFRGMKLLHKIL